MDIKAIPMLRLSLQFIVIFLFNSIIISAQSTCNIDKFGNIDSSQLKQILKDINFLKLRIYNQQSRSDKFTNTFLFLDAAIGSANNLQSLILKESYRNKIASLNNPTSNELGFNLEMEIQSALKPLMLKAHKTNTTKFSQVIGSFVNTGKSTLSLFPAGNVFTGILSMVGNLTVAEKSIDHQDLDNFIKNIENYFNQYERLYQSNLTFNANMEKLKIRLGLLQDDIKLLLQDLILALDKNIKRNQLKNMSNEDLVLKYFDNKKIEEQLNKTSNSPVQFPTDAVKTCKDIANNIKRTYDEYATIYNSNFKEIKSIISDTKNVSSGVNQSQLNKTIKELESLYTDSKNMDSDNLRLKTLFDRLEEVNR